MIALLGGCRIHFDANDQGGSDGGGGDDGSLDDATGDTGSPITPIFVQSANVQTAVSTTGNLTIPSSVPGHLLVVVTVNIDNSSTTVSTLTDNAGNTYVHAGNVSWSCTGLSIGEIWYVANNNGGATTVTITQATATRREIWLVEAKGVRSTNALAGVLSQSDAPQGAMVGSPALTPSAIPAFVVATMNVTGGIIGFDGSTGFVRLGNLNGDEIAYAIGTTAGPYSSRWTTSAGGVYCSATVAFAAGL